MKIKYLVVPSDYTLYDYDWARGVVVCETRADAEEIVMDNSFNELYECFLAWSDTEEDFWKELKFIKKSCYYYWEILEVCSYGD